MLSACDHDLSARIPYATHQFLVRAAQSNLSDASVQSSSDSRGTGRIKASLRFRFADQYLGEVVARHFGGCLPLARAEAMMTMVAIVAFWMVSMSRSLP